MSSKFRRLISIFIIILSVALLTSCSKKPTTNNYDGKVFDLSLNSDQSVTAITKKVGADYELEIKGNGEVKSFEAKKLVPWNAIAKKIINVVVEEGIENIGNYYFDSLTLSEYYLPSSVTKIEENSFNKDAVIYSYSTSKIETYCQNKIYYHSITKPSVDEVYWHMVGNKPMVWRQYKMLFIGNSFTYYPTEMFSVENPAICSLLKDLASSMEIDVLADSVVKGAYTLKKFASSSDEMGKIVDEKLKTRSDYDFVILQEQSTTPYNDYNSFNSAVQTLVQKINNTQTNAKIVLYATWGYPAGVSEGSIFSSIASMEKALTDAYEKCASENDLQVNYVGKAFTYVYENYQDIKIYNDSDNRHQTYAGAYLSASVHLASLLGVNVENATFVGNLDENVARTLRQVAYQISQR